MSESDVSTSAPAAPPLAQAVEVGTYRLILHLVPSHSRHLARIEGDVAA